MRNLRMLIEYDGTDVCGWQYQPNKRTVQGEIENALQKLINEKIRIVGAGRTDQGVHALGQVANFRTLSQLACKRIKNGTNSLIGNDIYVKEIDQVSDDFHSRYSAKSKTYRYHVISEPSPLKIRYNWFSKYKLDLSKIEKVRSHLLGEHDFRNLCVNNGNDTICTLHSINLTEKNSQIIIEISGNRFLRKMVRGIVGFMHDVGRGRFSPDSVKDLFRGKIKDIYFAPPQGLFLVEVKY